jgi:DNA polymerase-3 subunit beta
LVARVPRDGTAEADFVLTDHRSVAGSVKSGGADEVLIEASKETIAFESGDLSITQKNTMHSDDFPTSIAVEREAFSATMSGAQVRALARVAAAMSAEETRYYLNGIFVHHIDGWTYRAVATDGHRLVFVDLELPDAMGATDGVIIPRKAIKLLLAHAGRSDSVRFRVGSSAPRNSETSTAPEKPGENKAEFAFVSGSAEVTMATKLIDGTYPDYKRVIPAGEGSSFGFKTADLKRAVEACSFGSDKVRAIKLRFDRDGLTCSRAYVETGITTAIQIPCEHANDGFEVGFNGRYLLDMLASAGGEEIVLNTNDSASPCLIKDPADPSWTGVLMPMRV